MLEGFAVNKGFKISGGISQLDPILLLLPDF